MGVSKEIGAGSVACQNYVAFVIEVVGTPVAAAQEPSTEAATADKSPDPPCMLNRHCEERQRSNPSFVAAMDCFACARNDGSKHLEIFTLFPVRDFGLEAFDFGVLDVDVIVDEFRTQRLAEERIVVEREHRFAQRPG
jgi:hypothetical protein